VYLRRGRVAEGRSCVLVAWERRRRVQFLGAVSSRIPSRCDGAGAVAQRTRRTGPSVSARSLRRPQDCLRAERLSCTSSPARAANSPTTTARTPTRGHGRSRRSTRSTPPTTRHHESRGKFGAQSRQCAHHRQMPHGAAGARPDRDVPAIALDDMRQRGARCSVAWVGGSEVEVPNPPRRQVGASLPLSLLPSTERVTPTA
jgi:hypothetical protein